MPGKMPSPQPEVVAGLLFAAGVLIALGYRIRFRREWRLITGFELGNVKDPEGLANWVGSVGIILGSLTFGAAAVAWSRPELATTLGSAYAVVVCAVTAVMAIGSARYV